MHSTACWNVTDNAGNNAAGSSEIAVDEIMPAGSIIINDGLNYTSSVAVSLALTYEDTVSGVNQTRYSNDNSTWSSWEAASATKAWNLTGGDGLKTVYYEVADNAGNRAQFTDTITLYTPDAAAPSAAMLSPSDGSVLSGVVALEANAADESGISRVDFYYYGPSLAYMLVGSDSVAPYSVDWNTARGTDGAYYVFVEAFDVYGNKKTTEGASERIHVTVKNAQTSTTTTAGSTTTTAPTTTTIPSTSTTQSVTTTSTSSTQATTTSSSTTSSSTTMPSSTTTSTTTATTLPMPLITGIRVILVSTDSATIVWGTNMECFSVVDYGTDGSYGLSRNGSGCAFNHSITLTGLEQNTTYYYRATAISRNSTESSRYGSFTTACTYIAPVQSANTVVVNLTDVSTLIEMRLNDTVDNGSVNITYSTVTPVNMTLAVAELGRYIKIEASPEVKDLISSVMLKVYYTDEELLDNNINESTLSIYWYNESGSYWVKLTTDLDWVQGTGVNTEQNYVWANVSHFSEYAVGGENICSLKGDLPACGIISLQEVIACINRWAAGRAQLQDVIDLIIGWTKTGAE